MITHKKSFVLSAYSNSHWLFTPCPVDVYFLVFSIICVKNHSKLLFNSHFKLLISKSITLGNLRKIKHQISGIFMKYLDISVISWYAQLN